MTHISATRYAKSVGLSIQKVHQILAENELYDLKNQQPTDRAFEQKFAMRRSVKDPYDKQLISFIAWDSRKIDGYFEKPSALELVKFNLKKSNVQNYLCSAIGDLGEILEIQYSAHCVELSSEANEAVIAAYYGELKTARGLRLLHRLFRKDEIESVKQNTLRVANELFIAIIKKKDEKLLKSGKESLDIIKFIMNWLDEHAT